MASFEKFSLRWYDFHENISSAFNNLRDDTHFTDVTLLSEDGHQIDVHKIILVSSSPFFMNILKTKKHPNPLIYLKGFKAKDLLSVIDFIYQGATEIHQHDLDSFLLVAEELQLKGLTGGDDRTGEKEEGIFNDLNNTNRTRQDKLISQYPEKTFKTNISEGQQWDSKQPSTLISHSTTIATNSQLNQLSYSGGSAEELKQTLWSMISLNGTVLSCTVCGKSKDKKQPHGGHPQEEAQGGIGPA